MKKRILPDSPPAIDRLLRHRWLAATVGSVSLLSMMAAFAIAPPGDRSGFGLRSVTEELPAPAVRLLESGATSAFLRQENVRRTDTVASLLSRLAVSDAEAVAFLRSGPQARRVHAHLQPGNLVVARTTENGDLLSLQVAPANKDKALVVERRGSGFNVYEQAIAFELRTVVSSGEINGSFFAAMDAAGVPDAVAKKLIEVFRSELDFHRDFRKGGRFSLVYEAYYHSGQLARTGRILGAEIGNPKKVLQAYWFQPERGEGAYYTANGGLLRKTFLLSPIEFSRISSGFSDERFHPILQTLRAHKGVDYAAPAGTPVVAVADGTVDTAESQNGYGNLIVLRHDATYSTAYGHLLDFAEGVRKGSRVRQGETIGYVGQTGLATGPHLHYEFRVNDEQVDPELAMTALPTSLPLTAAQLARLKEAIASLGAQLELAKQVTLAAIE